MFKFEKDAVFTVDEVTNKIREAIYASGDLQNISVKGELLGFKKHSSGHAYFTVIGAEARISCVFSAPTPPQSSFGPKTETRSLYGEGWMYTEPEAHTRYMLRPFCRLAKEQKQEPGDPFQAAYGRRTLRHQA